MLFQWLSTIGLEANEAFDAKLVGLGIIKDASNVFSVINDKIGDDAYNFRCDTIYNKRWNYGYNNNPNMVAMGSMDEFSLNIHKNESIGSSGIGFKSISND